MDTAHAGHIYISISMGHTHLQPIMGLPTLPINYTYDPKWLCLLDSYLSINLKLSAGGSSQLARQGPKPAKSMKMVAWAGQNTYSFRTRYINFERWRTKWLLARPSTDFGPVCRSSPTLDPPVKLRKTDGKGKERLYKSAISERESHPSAPLCNSIDHRDERSVSQ